MSRDDYSGHEFEGSDSEPLRRVFDSDADEPHSPQSKEREFALKVFRRGFTACSLERLTDFFDATGVQSFDDLPLLEPEEWQPAFQDLSNIAALLQALSFDQISPPEELFDEGSNAGDDDDFARLHDVASCPVCFDDTVSRKDGLLCPSNHFVCHGCFAGLVRSEATADDRLARHEASVGCCQPDCGYRFDIETIARHVPDVLGAVLLWQKALTEQRIVRDNEKEIAERVQHALKRREQMSPVEREVEDRRKHIIDDVLTLTCPRCRAAFVDFEGCFALSCSTCNCAFCAWCLTDRGDDAHPCAAACGTKYGAHDVYYGTAEQFDQHHRGRRQAALDAYLLTVSPAVQAALVPSLHQECRDLGLRLPKLPANISGASIIYQPQNVLSQRQQQQRQQQQQQQYPAEQVAVVAQPPAHVIPRAQSTSLYVGDLAPEVNEQVLYEVFNAIGPVVSIRVCRDAVTRRSLGYVNFQVAADAERALDSLNSTLIANRPCRIMWCMWDPAISCSGAGKIFVNRLKKSIDHKELHDAFSVFGNISACVVFFDKQGESTGRGFVHFETAESATIAIAEANGTLLKDKKITVAPFKSREELATENRQRFLAQRQGGPFMQGMLPQRMMYGMNPTQPRGFPGQLPYGRGFPQGPRDPMQPGVVPRGYPLARFGPPQQAIFPRQNRQQYPRGHMSSFSFSLVAGSRGQHGGRQQQPGARFNGQARNAPQGVAPEVAVDPQATQMQALASLLASAEPHRQKQILGDNLYHIISSMYPEQADKLTGMLLQMDNSDLLHLIQNLDALSAEVDRANELLLQHSANQ